MGYTSKPIINRKKPKVNFSKKKLIRNHSKEKKNLKIKGKSEQNLSLISPIVTENNNNTMDSGDTGNQTVNSSITKKKSRDNNLSLEVNCLYHTV